MQKILIFLLFATITHAEFTPKNLLTKSCLQSYLSTYKSQKNHKAFVYARERDTGKDRCNWAYGYNTLEEAINSAMKGCQSYPLNAECKVINKDGKFHVAKGVFTKLVPIDNTPLSKKEREALEKKAKKIIRGNCLPFFNQQYLNNKGHKAFAYSLDADGKYACGKIFNTTTIKSSKKGAIQGCENDKKSRGANAPKSPCKVYAIDKKIVLTLSDYGIKIEPKKDKSLSSEEYTKRLEFAKNIIDDGACLMQMKYYLRGKTQQAYYFAKSKTKEACGRADEAFTLKQAKDEAKTNCEKMAKKRGIKSGCKLLVSNYEIVGKPSDFGALKEGKEDFVQAIFKGNIKKIKAYIKKGYDVNTTSPKNGITPLFIAVGHGDEAFYKTLLKKGADIKHKLKDNSSLLLAAVMGRNPNIVHDLLAKGLDVNAKGTDGNTPLHASFMMLNTYMAGILMRHGADATIKNAKGMSAYDIAKKWKVNLDSYKTIDAKKTDHNGIYPLWEAAKTGDRVLIEKLIKEGADKEHAENELGYSPIYRAKDGETIKLLIKLGCNINAKDNDGNTPLMDMVGMLGAKEKIKTLLELGADTSIKNKEGKTVFDLVAEDKFVSKEIREMFIKDKK